MNELGLTPSGQIFPRVAFHCVLTYRMRIQSVRISGVKVTAGHLREGERDAESGYRHPLQGSTAFSNPEISLKRKNSCTVEPP